MQIVIKADTQQKNIVLAKGIPADVEVHWFSNDQTVPAADAYFDLLYDTQGAAFGTVTDKPVFANAVIAVCDELPDHYIRINAWSSFFERLTLEIAATPGRQPAAQHILGTLGWNYQWVADEPGMIAARVVAMIINEAYFALGDEVSTGQEIDTAMKLGTNYPYGPFEWAEKIGLKNIYQLLRRLSIQDSRYTPAPGMETTLQV